MGAQAFGAPANVPTAAPPPAGFTVTVKLQLALGAAKVTVLAPDVVGVPLPVNVMVWLPVVAKVPDLVKAMPPPVAVNV